MADIHLSIFVGFLLIQIGSAFLGWLGLFGPAVATLLMSCAGAVTLALLLQADSMRGITLVLTLCALALPIAVSLFIAALWRRKRLQRASTLEPDYHAIGQEMLLRMNANVAEKRARRSSRLKQ